MYSKLYSNRKNFAMQFVPSCQIVAWEAVLELRCSCTELPDRCLGSRPRAAMLL